MLTKNVYIVYPAGYHGSYIKWAIEVSDTDRRKTTVVDPLNRSSSPTHGGPGTSHGHTRIPTHQGIDCHTAWVIQNRPVDKLVYVISPGGYSQESLCNVIAQLLLQDPTGVVVAINDGNDSVTQSYGRINCVTKWPTYMAATAAYLGDENFGMHDTFDPFDCADDQLFRNGMIKNLNQLNNNSYDLSTASAPLDFECLDRLVARYNRWYKVRNQCQPHEVNEKTYVTEVDYTDRLYTLNITDIPDTGFVSRLQHIMDKAEISDSYDLDLVKKYHDEYISAQPNLQWFGSFAHWDQTGQLDDYILSHSIIQAELLREIMRRCHIRFDFSAADHIEWRSFYSQVRGPDWPPMPPTEAGFHQLPDWVKKEILIDFEYKLKNPTAPDPIMAALDWENMSLPDINLVYQTQIKKSAEPS